MQRPCHKNLTYLAPVLMLDLGDGLITGSLVPLAVGGEVMMLDIAVVLVDT